MCSERLRGWGKKAFRIPHAESALCQVLPASIITAHNFLDLRKGAEFRVLAGARRSFTCALGFFKRFITLLLQPLTGASKTPSIFALMAASVYSFWLKKIKNNNKSATRYTHLLQIAEGQFPTNEASSGSCTNSVLSQRTGELTACSPKRFRGAFLGHVPQATHLHVLN